MEIIPVQGPLILEVILITLEEPLHVSGVLYPTEERDIVLDDNIILTVENLLATYEADHPDTYPRFIEEIRSILYARTIEGKVQAVRRMIDIEGISQERYGIRAQTLQGTPSVQSTQTIVPGLSSELIYVYMAGSYENNSDDIEVFSRLGYPPSSREAMQVLSERLRDLSFQPSPAQWNTLIHNDIKLCSYGSLLYLLALQIVDSTYNEYMHPFNITEDSIYNALVRDEGCLAHDVEGHYMQGSSTPGLPSTSGLPSTPIGNRLGQQAHVIDHIELLEKDLMSYITVYLSEQPEGYTDEQIEIAEENLQAIRAIIRAVRRYMERLQRLAIGRELSSLPPQGTFPGGYEVRQAGERFRTGSSVREAGLQPQTPSISPVQLVESLSRPNVTMDDVVSVASRLGILPFSGTQGAYTSSTQGTQGTQGAYKVSALTLIAQRVAELLRDIQNNPNDRAAYLVFRDVGIPEQEYLASPQDAIMKWVNALNTNSSWDMILYATNALGITHIPTYIPQMIVYLREYASQL